MPDEIIEELWKIKDTIAREHDNDLRKLAAYLQHAYPEDPRQAPEHPASKVRTKSGLTQPTTRKPPFQGTDVS